jgi:hypothetical protein
MNVRDRHPGVTCVRPKGALYVFQNRPHPVPNDVTISLCITLTGASVDCVGNRFNYIHGLHPEPARSTVDELIVAPRPIGALLESR